MFKFQYILFRLSFRCKVVYHFILLNCCLWELILTQLESMVFITWNTFKYILQITELWTIGGCDQHLF